MVKMVDCSLELSKFELQLYCYVHFRTNTLGKDMNSNYPPCNGLNPQGLAYGINQPKKVYIPLNKETVDFYSNTWNVLLKA